jgi:hypothetical protein
MQVAFSLSHSCTFTCTTPVKPYKLQDFPGVTQGMAILHPFPGVAQVQFFRVLEIDLLGTVPQEIIFLCQMRHFN